MKSQRTSLPIFLTTVSVAFGLSLFTPSSRAQDQFVLYFPGSTAGVGDLGSVTFDSNGDFWVIGRSPIVAPVPVPRISKVSDNGSGWVADPHVLDEDMAFFYRTVDIESGVANANLGGPSTGTPASFLLNPAPLTITIPTGSGGTVERTYQPGELAYISDAMGQLAEPDGTPLLGSTKKIVRYDLRKVDNPNGTGVSGPTSQQPDFDNAAITDGVGTTITFGSFGFTDFNDAFSIVMSEQDLQDAAVASLSADFNGNAQVGATDLQTWQANYGNPATPSTGDTNENGQAEGFDFVNWQRQFGLRDGGSDNFGRSFAWSSDGQSLYAVDAGSNTGGIYRIDATGQNPAQRIWIDTRTTDGGSRINSEPAIVHTSVRNFDPTNATDGDQIIVEGSAMGGNNGGVNVYLDTGGSTVTQLAPLFTEQEFRDFAEYIGDSPPQFLSLTADAVGNLYFHEIRTDGIFLYDTAGRFAKIASEAEHNDFQLANSVGRNDTVLDMQVRTSNLPGFEVNEIIYTDDTLDAPVGVLAYKIGDFDRDDDVDTDDFTLLAAALGTRGMPADSTNYKFDLNGNAELAFDDDDQRFEHVSNGAMVVDWKDIKILQEFTDIESGDANFDGAVDFLDLDIMAANYFTIAGQTEETWFDGDFASVDPGYAFDAVDANLVNLVDLQVIADTWVNVLGQTPVTETDADAQGYTGQFRTDLLLAFASTGDLMADFNGDALVDASDLAILRANFGTSANGSTGDADGDGIVDGNDYLTWQREFTGASALSSASAVPEPSGLTMLLIGALATAIRRHT